MAATQQRHFNTISSSQQISKKNTFRFGISIRQFEQATSETLFRSLQWSERGIFLILMKRTTDKDERANQMRHSNGVYNLLKMV